MERKGRKGVQRQKLINDILDNYIQERQMPTDDRERKAVTSLYWLFRDAERMLNTDSRKNITYQKALNLMGKDVQVEILFFNFKTAEEFSEYDFNNGDMVGYDPITNIFRFVAIWINGKMSYRAVLRNLCLYVHDFVFLRRQPIEFCGRYYGMWLNTLMVPDGVYGVPIGIILHHSFPEMYISMGRNFFRDTLDQLSDSILPYNNSLRSILYDICDKSDIFNSLLDIEESIKFIRTPKNRKAVNEVLYNCPAHSNISDIVAIGKWLSMNLKVMIGHLLYILLLSSDLEATVGMGETSPNDIGHWLGKNDPEAYDAESDECETIYDF